MRVENVSIKGSWEDVRHSCGITVNKTLTSDITEEWKYKLLLSEHSPIRQIIVKATFVDIPYWVSVHLTRHKIGIEHWVRSQRTDRTGVDRNSLPQNTLVTHEIECNAQALINISRKRLCAKASTETSLIWIALIEEINAIEPELARLCVEECVYRGFCPEFKSCGFVNTPEFNILLKNYRKKEVIK